MAVWSVVGADLRRRWRSIIVLGVVAGIVMAVVLVAVAGARRTASTYPRFREATLEADASIEVSPDYFDAGSLRLPGAFAAIGPTNRPANVGNLERVEAFPLVIGGFLVLVAALAVAHTLVTSVRRRARDLAVLETIGFVGKQIRGTVAWQASTLGAIGLLFGIPAGIIVGRIIWQLVATGLGVDTAFDVPWLAIVLTIPAALLLVNLLAILPARRAARTRPATVLRSE